MPSATAPVKAQIAGQACESMAAELKTQKSYGSALHKVKSLTYNNRFEPVVYMQFIERVLNMISGCRYSDAQCFCDFPCCLLQPQSV
jgi:hypothetical protein